MEPSSPADRPFDALLSIRALGLDAILRLAERDAIGETRMPDRETATAKPAEVVRRP